MLAKEKKKLWTCTVIIYRSLILLERWNLKKKVNIKEFYKSVECKFTLSKDEDDGSREFIVYIYTKYMHVTRI